MIINISGDINVENVDLLIEALNKLMKDEKLIVYLNSNGGDSSCIPLMVDIINQNSDKVELVGYNELLSAGFDVFFKSRCHKIILTGTYGMTHFTRVNVEINENGKTAREYDKALKEYLKIEKKKTSMFCKSIGMTEKETNKVLKGGEIYFQYDRLIEMLTYQKSNGEYLEYIH